MPVYLYCLTAGAAQGVGAEDEDPSVADVPGIDGSAVRRVRLDPAGAGGKTTVEAWVGDLPQGPARTAAHALDHHRVCDRAAASGRDVVPARFGQTFPDDVALRRDLEARSPALEELWRQVSRAVEMSMVIPVPSALIEPDAGGAPAGTAGSSGTGRAYLDEVAGPVRAARRAREAVDRVRRALGASAGDFIRAEVVWARTTPPVAVTLAHLIDRERVPVYRTIVGGLEALCPAGRALVSGPSAPYSFVGLPPAGPAGKSARTLDGEDHDAGIESGG